MIFLILLEDLLLSSHTQVHPLHIVILVLYEWGQVCVECLYLITLIFIFLDLVRVIIIELLPFGLEECKAFLFCVIVHSLVILLLVANRSCHIAHDSGQGVAIRLLDA